MKQVTLTMQDQRTYDALRDLDEGRITTAEAAHELKRSTRQVRRRLKAFREDGLASIPHKNRGRKPPNAIPQATRQHVLQLMQDQYRDCNNHHLRDLLEDRQDICLSVSSVRRLREQADLRSPRTRRAPKHRSRRPRKPCAGVMLQLDGSPFAWLGPDGPVFSLLGAIDDATGHVCALFRPQEDTVGYLLLLRQVIAQHGVPLSLYSDRHTIFRSPAADAASLDQQLAGEEPQTQFSRAARQLDIDLLRAHSPQAKGRVEKLWNTLQDRLTQEMRLDGITTLEEANAYLPAFLERYNARFAQEPAQPETAYRPAPPQDQLDQVLCLEFDRRVANDHTIAFGGHTLDLPRNLRRSYAKARVILRVALDGQLTYWYQGQCLGQGPRFQEPLSCDPSRLADQLPVADAPKPTPDPPRPSARKRKPPQAPPPSPPPDHPWRKFRYGKNDPARAGHTTRSVLPSSSPPGG